MTNFDSVDELVKRRNDVIRLDKQRLEDKCVRLQHQTEGEDAQISLINFAKL